MQVGGTAYGFMSISDDINYNLLNECFELGPFHGLKVPCPDDDTEPPKPPTPAPAQGKAKNGNDMYLKKRN